MKAKLLIGISAALVAGLGGYYLYKTKFKKKDEEPAAEETPAAEQTPAPVKTPKSPKSAPVKTPVVPVRTPGFVEPPKGPASVATKTPAMGAKIFALSANGANAYKTAKASQTNLYKYYTKGGYIGTYLGKEGIFAKVVVLNDGIMGGTKVVFVPAKDIEATSK